jgi:biopolymer transport protein ExbD
MAGGMDVGQGGGKGGKKPLDTAINLVPFIDLMAVTISFLIMTAVWTQIGRLQVSQAGGEADPTEEQPKTVPLSLLITEKEVRLSAGGTSFDPIPLTRNTQGKLELTKLTEKIKELKTQLPDQTQITLNTEDAVRYEDLVKIIDECIGAGLPNVTVAAAMG